MSLGRYFAVLVLSFLGLAGANQIGLHAVRLGCWPGGYAQDGWMAYCNSTLYGVFDPDAIWFELEPETTTAIRNARVLTLSDSRLQNALSLGGASEWFVAHGYPAYFLGLPTQESGFGEHLIERFQPQASVIIFEPGPYFTGRNGAFLDDALARPALAKTRAQELQVFEGLHQRFCGQWPALCGFNFSYFRARSDGHWIFPPENQRLLIAQASLPNDRLRFPVDTQPDELVPLYPEFLDHAGALLAKLPLRRECIVITHVPTDFRDRGIARYLSSELGVTLIDPDVPDLSTFDRAHLTPQSSKRWTAAFLEALEPVLARCVPAEDPRRAIAQAHAAPSAPDHFSHASR